MKYVNTQFLTDIGITEISDAQAARMLQDIVATLEMRVAMAAANTLDEKTLDSINIEDDLTADWMSKNIPSYQQIVTDEAEKLKQEFIDDQKKLSSND